MTLDSIRNSRDVLVGFGVCNIFLLSLLFESKIWRGQGDFNGNSVDGFSVEATTSDMSN